MPKGHKQGCRCAVCKRSPKPVSPESINDKPHFEALTMVDKVRRLDKPHDEAPHE